MKIHNKKFYLLLGIILFIILIFCINQIYKSRFGYFKTEGSLNYPHPNADAFLIQNNKIFILGDTFNNIPNEIYNINNKASEIYKFKNNLLHSSEGVLVDVNRLFLLRTCINSKCGMSVLYNLNSNKIDYIYDNTFDIFNANLNNQLLNYLLLSNKNIFYISHKSNNQYEIGIFKPKKQDRQILLTDETMEFPKSIQLNDTQILIMSIHNAYIFDIEHNKLTKLNFPYVNYPNPIVNNQRISHLIKFKDKILIFIYLVDNSYKGYNLTLVFDIKSKEFSKLSSSSIIRDAGFRDASYVSSVIKLNNQHILLTGGLAPATTLTGLLSGHNLKRDSAEIYDIKKDEFYRIVNMPSAKFGHRSILISNNEIYIVGGQTNKLFGTFYGEENRKIIKFKILI